MLKISNLTCGYDDRAVINDVSFEVNQGEIVGIIGPNGSGKTTLFRTITRVIPQYSGHVLYRDKEISSWHLRELSKEIAVLPQFIFLQFPFSVNDFIALGRNPYLGRLEPIGTEDQTIISQAMELTETKRLASKLITELSGGELQRVYLAQALAQQPKLLLLDEPTAHLDIGHQIEILHLLRYLNKEKELTVVIILHDLNLAAEYCHRLVMLNNGRIEAIGSPKEVLTFPIIEKVYKTVVVVKENPISEKPYVFLVPKDKWTGKQKGE
ncbi:MAG: heme ABC transporter ATP-binding protein [Candidatus Brocadiia bacterium]